MTIPFLLELDGGSEVCGVSIPDDGYELLTGGSEDLSTVVSYISEETGLDTQEITVLQKGAV